MSIRLMAEVWEDERLSGDVLLLALALADHADDYGRCWPSVTRLAQRIRKSRRHTMRLLKTLECNGYITPIREAGRVNRYTIAIPATSDIAMSPVKNVTSDIAMSPVLVTQLCHGTSDIAMSPEPSCNHQLNRHAKRAADYLPTAEEQAAILFPGGNGRQTDSERLLQQSGWQLPTDELKIACLAFIDATGIAPPKTKPARGEWIKVLAQHIEEYGTADLPRLYGLAVDRLKGLTIGRPGSLTNTLPAVAQHKESGVWQL